MTVERHRATLCIKLDFLVPHVRYFSTSKLYSRVTIGAGIAAAEVVVAEETGA
jgi:hypothetical protein